MGKQVVSSTEHYYLEERAAGKKRKSQGPKKNKENKKQKTTTKSVPEENSEEEDDAELKIKVQQQKCALHSFYVLMHRYREKIPQRTWDLLAQTTFWDTIDVFKNEKLTERQVKKHELDFELIMKHYNKEKTKGEVVDLKNKHPRNKWPDSKYFEKGRISKDNIKRPQLETELSAELNKPEKNQDAEKIASLILIKDKAQIYSGCILLVVYWFLEKTRVRNKITGNETSTLRFVRWSIKEIFDRKDVQKKPTFLEDLIKEGPWEEETDDNEMEEEDCMMEEQDYTPSFNEWVPQSSQQEEEQLILMSGNLRALMRDLERKQPEKTLKEKLEKLTKANEELLEKNAQLLTKVKAADIHIEQLQKENKELRESLKKAKAKKTKKKNIPLKMQMVVAAPNEHLEKNEPNTVDTHSRARQTSTPEDSYGATLAIPIQTIVMGYGAEQEDSTMCQEIIQTVVMDIVKQQQQQEKVKENESLKTYKKKPQVYIEQTEEEINSSMDDFVAVVEKEEEARAKKKVVQSLSIERNVKVNKRDATKKQQEEWEYGTPEDLKPKKNQPARRNISKNHNIVIDKVKCTTQTWTTLEKDVAMHYENWFKTNQEANKDYVYWQDPSLIVQIKKEDLKAIIEEGELTTDVLKIYIQMLKEKAKRSGIRVGFLDVEAAVKHIRRFMRLAASTYPESQDPEEFRDKNTGEDEHGLIETKVKMTDEEKEIRQWVLSNNVNEEQSDCGPYMLHNIESLMYNLKPTKKGGDNMRKQLLRQFMKIDIEESFAPDGFLKPVDAKSMSSI
ncbi:hypothetical protein ACLB2K_016618 [Fragaria x ananassa]